MKKAEAISILATSVRPREAKDRARYDKAVKMAIEALKCSETPKSSERPAESAQNVQNGDLIQRKAALEALAMMMPRSYTPDGSHPADEEIFRAQEVFADCIEALEILPSAQPEPHWIPCSERLPKKERRTYWVCTDAGTQHECRWTNNRFGMTVSDKWGWSIFDTPQYTKVIAWMPLPEPYREGGQDENR